MKTRGLQILTVLCALLSGRSASAVDLAFEVIGGHQPCRLTPVTIEIPYPGAAGAATLQAGVTYAQLNPSSRGRARVTWLIDQLGAGEKRIYRFHSVQPHTLVRIVQKRRNVDILIGQALFATYDTQTGPNKPYFYPINAPPSGGVAGPQLVRHWPVQKVPGESGDHPHHRGLWFTHGNINGVDFWSEGKHAGRTLPLSYRDRVSGPVFGSFTTENAWNGPDGQAVARDTRTFAVFSARDACILDFEVTLRSAGPPLTFGDTKEGSLGIRVADSMRVSVGKGEKSGHIVNSEGVTDRNAWGKRANWCAYYGPVQGQSYTIAILDHPENPRHPTFWHVRDYGLFAANPFGAHSFDAGHTPVGAGTLSLPPGRVLTLRYRLIFLRGAPAISDLEEIWNGYSAAPAVRQLMAAERTAPGGRRG